MKPFTIILPFFLFLLTLWPSAINAQKKTIITEDQDILPIRFRPGKDSCIKIYKNTISKKSGHINGREYKPYFLPKHSSPYLMSNKGFGTIYMQGYVYENCILFYDINLDELILIPAFSGLSKFFIQINKFLIDSFEIKIDPIKLKFIHIVPSDKSLSLVPGFYEIVYSGKYEYLIKHTTFKTQEYGYDVYNYKKINYLKINGIINNIDTKKRFIKSFDKNGQILKKRINHYGPNYKNLSPIQMADLIKFAELL
jgi:hypothetical protein